ncbi:MAG TPA: glycerophosphodiester phosphodiesterase family protein [Bryobacteraceae bacterium]|nr:glycerophosphodiester phosphodiesterase family protein [Bryobacteraceae bacterium]
MPLHKSLLLRRELLAIAGLPLAKLMAQSPGKYHLIAHRGGVVDDAHPENSPGSIQAAIDRGYWMLEVDIRRTKDGEPLLQHDPTFSRFYGDDRTVEQMTWAEVQRLRSKPGDTSPIHFRDVCRMCKGRVRLMLDIKSDSWPDEFYQSVIRDLGDHNLLHSAYLLGGGKLNPSTANAGSPQTARR